MSTKIWPKVAGLLLIFVSAMPAMANTIYSYSALGAANPVTTGTDPFGNQWQISEFFGDAVFSIPGMPSLQAGSGPCQWAGPDCLIAVTVTAWEELPGGGLHISVLDPFGLTGVRNVTSNASYAPFQTVKNQIVFTAPSAAAVINTGEFMRAFVYSALPLPGNQMRYDVIYETAPCETPEPGTYALVGGALAVVGLWKRRGRM